MPISGSHRYHFVMLLAGLTILQLTSERALAASAVIVALGASNTEGMKLTTA